MVSLAYVFDYNCCFSIVVMRVDDALRSVNTDYIMIVCTSIASSMLMMLFGTTAAAKTSVCLRIFEADLGVNISDNL